MEDNTLRYDAWIEQALRQVIRRALNIVATEGLPGDHHFYITFMTDEEDVVMPASLREKYQDEMTIVLQHQFDSLTVLEDGFEVTLYFGGSPMRLAVPFAAVTSFADPSVNFGLQLKTMSFDGLEDELDDDLLPEDLGLDPMMLADEEHVRPTSNQDDAKAGDGDKSGQVIALDAFRKKS
ncbi:MAG: ClpXP protease specificity-enhancing factor SspB [Proteobacteria bacterium]|nr:ClpXP protease specificity-enhancing factor SspB [Pseudomonadota bacterium]